MRGVIEPGERIRREASARPLAAHIEDYRLELLARGDTCKHASHATGVLDRVLADAGVESITRLAPDRIQGALGRLKARRSARTANHARGVVVAFAPLYTRSHPSTSAAKTPRKKALKPTGFKAPSVPPVGLEPTTR